MTKGAFTRESQLFRPPRQAYKWMNAAFLDRYLQTGQFKIMRLGWQFRGDAFTRESHKVALIVAARIGISE